MNDKHLDAIIIAFILTILFCIYAGYQLVYHPSIEIKRTVITLPASDSIARSYGVHAGDAP